MPNLEPTFGNTSTIFNYSLDYSHIGNKAPLKIVVNVSGIEYPMVENDSGNLDYLNGKIYYFKTTLNISNSHTYKFFVTDGENTTTTRTYHNPVVYNTFPNITTENNLTAIEDVHYEVDYEYQDIDILNVGQLGLWNYSTNASWLEFNRTTGILNGTPENDDVGTYWVNISINDTIDIGHTNFTVIVVNVNDPPEIVTTNIEIAYEDELYEVTNSANDIDSPQNILVWMVDSNASWLGFNPLTATLSGIPSNDDVGIYWVEIIVNDTLAESVTNFTLTVFNVNDRPEIITEDLLTASTESLYLVDYNATDIDNPQSDLLWFLTTNATWLDIDISTGILEGTPDIDDVGWYNVNLTVDDNAGGQDSHEFVLYVILGNQPPEIITEDVTSAVVDEKYEVDYDATDINTPITKLTWSLQTNASWLIIDKNQGILTGIPKIQDLGWYWVNVRVTDDEGAFDFNNFTLTVYLIKNQPPEISTIDLEIIGVGEYYSVDYNATDDRTLPEGLRWYLHTNASWLSIDIYSGLLAGKPTENDIGTYWVEVTVFDTDDGVDIQNFTLRVIRKPISKELIVLSSPTMTPNEGDTDTEFEFTVHYYQSENIPPEYIQLIIDDDFYSMDLVAGENASDGTYMVKVKLSEGNHTYYFSASDGIHIVTTDIYVTGEITKIDTGVNGTQDKKSDDWVYWLIAIVIIIIIVIVVFIMIFLKKKKKEEKPEAQPALPPPAPEPEAVATPQPFRLEPQPPPQAQLAAQPMAAPPSEPVAPAPIPQVAPPTTPQLPTSDDGEMEE